MMPRASLSAVFSAGLLLLAGGTATHAAPAAANPVLRSLDGETPEAVRLLLGEPDVAHAEGEGALWTYRFETCALMVGFRQSDHGLKVTSTVAGPRQRGRPEPSTVDCLGSGVAAHREAGARPPPLPRETTIGPPSPPVPQSQVPR
jgi:hypothetical protein